MARSTRRYGIRCCWKCWHDLAQVDGFNVVQIKALTLLSPELLWPAIRPTVVLCPYCQLRNGQIYGDGQAGQFCQCSDCGPIALTADDRAAVMLDEQWLRSRLRIALEIESRDGGVTS